MQIKNLTKDSFSNLTVLTIGDGMLDRYYYGEINRKSPEADVDIVDVQEKEDKLGGAANVALNIATMGAQSVLISLAGRDEDSQIYQNLLQGKQVIAQTLITARPMTVKTRIYNKNNYVLRLDREVTVAVDELISKDLLTKIEDAIASFQPDICILQDYNKGIFTKENISNIIQLLKKHDILIAVDPKEANFFEFKNVDLFKPNAKEVATALQTQFAKDDKKALEQCAIKLYNKLNFNKLLLTLSEYGAMIYSNNSIDFVAAQPRNVVDVSGAGDTVIAMAALLLSLGFDLKAIAYYSNLAGGLVIEKKGVSTLTIEDFLKNIETTK